MRRPLEFGQSPADQVEADVPRTIIGHRGSFGRGCPARQLKRLARHLAFCQTALLRNLFSCMAVAIAARKFHAAVDAVRIRAQRALHDAQGLDELAPVHRTQNPEAADAVADGHLIGGLPLVLGLHQLANGQGRFGKSLLDPGQRQCQRGTATLQPAREFRDERTDHRRTGARHVRDHQNQALRILLGGLRHQVRPEPGKVSLGAACGNLPADAAQILDDCQPQHDRNRPQLANLEGGDALVGRHKAAQTFRVHATVAVRHGVERDVIHARTPCGRTHGQPRQFAAVALWQVPLGGANLIFDEVEIVEQPFPGRRNSLIRRNRRCQLIADADQYAFIRGQPGQQMIGSASRSEPVQARQHLAMLLHLLGTEELRAQRLLVVRGVSWRAVVAEVRRPCEQIAE